jgi:hypothetical protein
MLSGTELVSELFVNDKNLTFVSVPIDEGTEPTRRLLDIATVTSDVRLPMVAEMLPVRPFNARFSEVTAPEGEHDTKLHEHTALSGTPPVHDQPLVKTAVRNPAFVAAATEHIAASLTEGVGNCVGTAVGTRVGFGLGRLVGWPVGSPVGWPVGWPVG